MNGQTRLSEISDQLAQMEEEAKEILVEKEKIETDRSAVEEKLKDARQKKEHVEEEIKQLGLSTVSQKHKDRVKKRKIERVKR